MKITYLAHGALKINTDNISIVTDPWINGPAYCNQWYQFPKPHIPQNISETNFILYSHGHEDHLHFPSLELFSKNTTIFYPYSWFGSAKKFFKQAGFTAVTEAINKKKYELVPGISITYFTNNLDNIVIIECDGKVILNLNDALASAPDNIINYVVDCIKKLYPKIDYLLTSYGGAAFFPNCFTAPGKNNTEVAFMKEIYILNNACKVIAALNPKNVLFFASDYVLLHPQQQWMNDLKISKKEAADYYTSWCTHHKIIPKPTFIEMYPGDILENNLLHKVSSYHQLQLTQKKSTIIQQEYTAEINEKIIIHPVSLLKIKAFEPILAAFIEKKRKIIPAALQPKIIYSVKIADAETGSFFIIDLNNEIPVSFSTNKHPSGILDVTINFETLKYAIEEQWGGDAIVIGYGCHVEIYNTEILSQQLDIFCIQLICNYPSSKDYLLKNPLRSLRYIYNDKLKRNVILNKLLHKKTLNFSNTTLNDSKIWLTRNKCEICNACNLPEIKEIDNFLYNKIS